MPFIDALRRLWGAPKRRLGRAAAGAAVAAAAGCAQAPPRPAVDDTAAPALAPASVLAWQAYRREAAERIMAAAPDGSTYRHRPPEPLLGIPVLQVWLHADGSVARIEVLREPHLAKHVTALAVDAVNRAAPFGSVAHLPRPWTFVETFLFDDTQRFMPASLDVY